MDRKKFIQSIAGSGLGMLGGVPFASSVSDTISPSDTPRSIRHLGNQDDRPNILVILADDMGFSDVSCYGSEIDTPNIDRLADGGLRFTQFYNTARCCPTRASLMTGLYPHEADIGHMAYDLGVPGYRDRLSRNAVTIPEVLGEAGYRTMMCGKWHLGWTDEGSPPERGFQRFYGTRGYVDSYYTIVPKTEVYLDQTRVLGVTKNPVNHLHPDQEWYTTDVYTDYGIEFMDEAIAHNAPFFLYMAYNAPHFPLHAKPEDLEKYRGRYKKDGYVQLRKERYRRLVEIGIIRDQWELSPHDSPDWDSLTDAQQDELDLKMALYAAIIDRLDQNIGRLIEKLETGGQLDNTLILFLSDNGGTAEGGLYGINEDAHVDNYEEWAREGGWSSSYGQGWANLSNTPFRLYKKYTHEGGASAPLIAHWPDRIKDGGSLRHQVSHVIDIMATCADAAGTTYPGFFNEHEIKPLRGQSLLPVFDNEGEGHRRLYWEHEGNRAIRHGDWKLVARHGEPWSLYNMAEDRPELHNRIGEKPGLVNDLKADYLQWARNCNVLPRGKVQALMEAKRG